MTRTIGFSFRLRESSPGLAATLSRERERERQYSPLTLVGEGRGRGTSVVNDITWQ